MCAGTPPGPRRRLARAVPLGMRPSMAARRHRYLLTDTFPSDVTVFLTVVCAVVGLAVGSFLNVVIHRVPARASVVSPRSRCPECGTEISPRDNIPVLS